MRKTLLAVTAGLLASAGLRADDPPALPPPAAPAFRESAAVPGVPANVVPIDLLSTLRAADASNPVVAIARERIREALAVQKQAGVLWLPSAFVGGNPEAFAFVPTFFHHDGNIQNARGQIFSTTRNAFFFPTGLTVDFNLGEAIFAPLIARRGVGAVTAAARATSLNVQLDAALTYLDLLRTYGRLAILAETIANAEEFLRLAVAAEEAKTGKTPADVPRARAELRLRQEERDALRGQALVLSARLAQLLLMPPTLDLRPADPAILPIRLVDPASDLDKLVTIGWMNRPELAEQRALVSIQLARRQQAQVAPFVPRLQAAYYAGTYGGGTDFLGGSTSPTNFSGREDFLVQASWQLRNLGLGNYAEVQVRRSQLLQSQLRLTEVQAQVGAEVTAAAQTVRTRQAALGPAEDAVRQAAETYRRLSEARFGMIGREKRFDPLEGLTAEQTLAEARNRYLDAVIEFNRAQFRLYAALGQPPLCAAQEQK